MSQVVRARETFGPYEIVSKLGVGGMAETYVAVRRGPGGFAKDVCLKRVLPAFADDERFQKMFFAEAKIAAKLRHGQVVQLVDFGEIDGTYFLALELVDGCDLRKLIRAQKDRLLDLDVTIYILHELLAALSYVHAVPADDGSPLGLVHRDISPANVLLSTNGEVKLADFGVAKATNAPGTASVAVKGKIPYMAAEQFELRADARSDLFSLGVVAYEMLAGRRPFDAATDAGTMMLIVKGQFAPLATVRPDVPKALASAVDRMLAREAADRFASADEAIDAIMDVVPPPSVRARLSTLVQKAARDQRAPAGPPSQSASGVRESQTPREAPIPGTVELPPELAPTLRAVVAQTPAPSQAPRESAPVAPARSRAPLFLALAAIPIVLIAAIAIAVVVAMSGSDPAPEPTVSEVASEPSVAPPEPEPEVVEPPVDHAVSAGDERTDAPDVAAADVAPMTETTELPARGTESAVPTTADSNVEGGTRPTTRVRRTPRDREPVLVAQPPPTLPQPPPIGQPSRARPGDRATVQDFGL
jgi:serine/threonine protein kinase